MAGKYDIGPRIGIEGEAEYRQQLRDMNNSLKLLGSEMEKNIVVFNKNIDSVEAMTETSKNLSKQYDVQVKKVATMQEALQKAKSEYGENSSQVKKYQTSLNKAEAALGKTENALKDVNDKLEKSKKRAKESESAFGKLAQNSKKLEGGLSKASMAIGALAVGIAAAIEGTRELRTNMAMLETNTIQAGENIGKMNAELAKMQAITGETDSNIEGLSNLLQAGFKGDKLTEAVNQLSGAVIKFPDTLKIESLADSLQETIATGKATGQFGELLERMGMNLESFDRGLQRCATSTQKQDYALRNLSKMGLSKTYELFKKNNKELFVGAEMHIKFQEAMARIGENLEKTFVQLSPVLVPLIEGFTELVGVISQIPAPVLAVMVTMAAMVPIALSIMKAITQITEFTGKTASPTMIKTTVIILGIVAALAALAAIIAVIQGRGKELQGTMQTIGKTTGNIGRVPHYASGTDFHMGGLALVGEEGPELVNMPRGSSVFTADRTRGMMGGAQNNYYVTIDAKNVKEFNDIVRIAQNQKLSRRMGYARG